MHCPNCGMEASAGQKFCRACGFGLEKVEQLIADQRTAGTDQTTEATSGLSDDRLRKLEKWVVRAVLSLGSILGGLMLWAIIGKLMIEEGKVLPGSILLMVIALISLLFLTIYLESQRKKPASARLNEQQHLTPAEETAKMLSEPNLEMTASVTEHTTARLGERVITPVEKSQSN